MKAIKTAFVLIFLLFVVTLSAASEKTYLKQGAKLYAAKNYKAAYLAFEKASKINPENFNTYIYMAYCKIYMRDKKGAIANFEKALRIKDSPTIRKYVQALIYGKTLMEEYYYTGGDTRAEALGGPTLVVRDASAPLDLYGGADNTAALAFRQMKNFVTAGLGFNPSWGAASLNETIPSLIIGMPSVTYNVKANESANLFLIDGDMRNHENIATYWLDNNDVLSAKMMFANIGTSASASESAGFMGALPQITLSGSASLPGNEFLGDVEYARKITNMLSAGITLGYEGGWFNFEGEKISSGKLDWGLSAAYTPDLGYGKITTGIQISDMDLMVEDLEFSSYFASWDATFAQYPFDYIALMNSYTYDSNDGVVTQTNNNVSGVNTSISGSFVKDTLEILSRVSLTLGINDTVTGTITDDGVTENQQSYNDETGGATLGMMLKSRYGLGMFDLGLGITWFSSGYKLYAMPDDPNPHSRSIGYFKLTAGTDFKPTELFMIPFEVFYEGTGYKDVYNGGPDSNSYSTIGVSAGCEYKLTTELSLRGGLSWMDTNDTTMTGGVSGPSAGTTGNPSDSRFGITLGAGYLLKPVQLDGIFGFYMDGQGPLQPGETYSADSILLAVSAIIPI